MTTASPLSVLYVDDDPFSIDHLRSLASDLKGEFKFRFFGSAVKAEKSHLEDPADIFISDLRMGSEDGLALIARVQKSVPSTIYMLSSGAADLSSALTAVNDVKILKFFLKPVSLETLDCVLEEAVEEIYSKKFLQLSSLTLNAFEQVSSPTVILDSSYSVVLKNRAANELLTETKSFMVGPAGKLIFQQSDNTKKFHDWLDKLKSTASGLNEPAIFRLANEDRDETYILLAKFCSDDKGDDGYINLSISNPTQANLPTTNALSCALNISPSEARVVSGLIQSGNVLDAAKLSGVAVSTARTYLRAVFSKTGVSKQAELVRLALTSTR